MTAWRLMCQTSPRQSSSCWRRRHLAAYFLAVHRISALAVPTTDSARSNQSCCLPAMAITMPARHWTAGLLLPSWRLDCPLFPLLLSSLISSPPRIYQDLPARCCLIKPSPHRHWKISSVSALTTRFISFFRAGRQVPLNASSMASVEQHCSMPRSCACNPM